MTKTCQKCGDTLDARCFRTRTLRYWVKSEQEHRTREYPSKACRECEREYSRAWRVAHPGYHAAWSKACRDG